MNLVALVFVRPPSARVEAFSFRVVSRLQPSPRPGGLRTGFLTKPRLHFSSGPRGPLHRASLESDLDARPYLLLREGRHCGVCPACSASSTKNLFSPQGEDQFRRVRPGQRAPGLAQVVGIPRIRSSSLHSRPNLPMTSALPGAMPSALALSVAFSSPTDDLRLAVRSMLASTRT